MASPTPRRRLPFAAVAACFLVLITLGAALWWGPWDGSPKRSPAPDGPLGSGILEPFRVPGGSLQTNGITKTEEFRSENDSWMGTTASGIRLNATYRYEIELRSKWNMHFDEERQVAFVVAPAIKPQLPVAVDSASVQEWTKSGWGRFDKWPHLQGLRNDVSRHLEEKAKSQGYRELARGDARRTVEEFVSDWILKHRSGANDPPPVIKVYFEDEDDVPYPKGRSLKDFLP